MSPPRPEWSWVGARATGTSHAGDEEPCADAGACREIRAPNGPTLVAVASDGAGSAPLSHLGSAIVARSFCRSASAHLRAGRDVAAIDASVAGEWLDEIRDRIARRAELACRPPRAFASTMVGVVVGPDAAVVVHVGDGACALRVAGETTWRVPSWPAQGEYAATTYFVTDDPEPRLSVVLVEERVEEVAVFTDGMERLALDFAARTAFDRFFESVFPALRRAPPGRGRALSRDLHDFLDSAPVTDRTEDDKTLVMARRVPAAESGLRARTRLA